MFRGRDIHRRNRALLVPFRWAAGIFDGVRRLLRGLGVRRHSRGRLIHQCWAVAVHVKIATATAATALWLPSAPSPVLPLGVDPLHLALDQAKVPLRQQVQRVHEGFGPTLGGPAL